MKIILDTHALLWWWSLPDRLSARVLALIRDPDNEISVSAASAWEISTKTRIGKLPEGGSIMSTWDERVRSDRFRQLEIGWRHALKAGRIVSDHRDPFDRMIAAQSLIEGIPVASVDPAISHLGAERIWE